VDPGNPADLVILNASDYRDPAKPRWQTGHQAPGVNLTDSGGKSFIKKRKKKKATVAPHHFRAATDRRTDYRLGLGLQQETGAALFVGPPVFHCGNCQLLYWV